jgi:hypothetical protein
LPSIDALDKRKLSWMENANATALFEVYPEVYLDTHDRRHISRQRLGANKSGAAGATGAIGKPAASGPAEGVRGGRVR